jgi:hypothetical protein
VHARLRRERRTVEVMIRLYCLARHGRGPGLCADCTRVSEYAARKIDRCPFRAAKPVCVDCRVHCYSPAMRDEIRAIMRYAGPRMIFRHPGLALMHILDGVRGPSRG